MGALAVLLRLVLAVVFAVAAVAKLADRGGARDGLREFGVPTAVARPLAVLLPAAEIVVAGALLAPATAWWGGAAALALLLVFIAVLAGNLARGRTPPCHCFGALHLAPTGASALARTGGLAILAGAVVALGRDAVDRSAWVAHLSGVDAVAVGAGAAMLAMLAAGAALFVALAAQNGRILARIEALERAPWAGSRRPGAATGDGLPIGAAAPAFTITDTDGGGTSLDDLRAAGNPIVLLFSDPGCGPCRAMRPDVAGWRRKHSGALEIVVLERRPDVASAYDAHATPTAVLVGADGAVGSRPAVGARAIADLIERTVGPVAAADHAAADAGCSPVLALGGHRTSGRTADASAQVS